MNFDIWQKSWEKQMSMSEFIDSNHSGFTYETLIEMFLFLNMICMNLWTLGSETTSWTSFPDST